MGTVLFFTFFKIGTVPFYINRKIGGFMINKTINYNGNQYLKRRIIHSEKKTYIEYRNEELQLMKFFEVYGESIQPVSDLKDLELAIKKNYVIENKDDII